MSVLATMYPLCDGERVLPPKLARLDLYLDKDGILVITCSGTWRVYASEKVNGVLVEVGKQSRTKTLREVVATPSRNLVIDYSMHAEEFRDREEVAA